MDIARRRPTYDYELAVWWVIVISVVVTLALIGMAALIKAQYRRECLQLGYPESTWGPLSGGYCLAREQQADVVVTVEQARTRPRRPR